MSSQLFASHRTGISSDAYIRGMVSDLSLPRVCLYPNQCPPVIDVHLETCLGAHAQGPLSSHAPLRVISSLAAMSTAPTLCFNQHTTSMLTYPTCTSLGHTLVLVSKGKFVLPLCHCGHRGTPCMSSMCCASQGLPRLRRGFSLLAWLPPPPPPPPPPSS